MSRKQTSARRPRGGSVTDILQAQLLLPYALSAPDRAAMWAAILRSCLVSLPQSGEAETEVAAASRASQVPAFGSKTYHSRALCRCRRYDRRLLDSGVPRRLGLFVDRINILTRAYAATRLACHAASACVFNGTFVGLILLAGNTHERLTLFD